jgi:hypothetical protein
MRTAAVYQSFFCHCHGICRLALPSVYGIYKYQITGEIADSFPVIRIFLFISQTVTPLGSLALHFDIPCKHIEFNNDGIMAGCSSCINLYFFLPVKPARPDYPFLSSCQILL